MQLQLALDRLTKEDCIRMINETKNYIDLVEIGTGIIKKYGNSIIQELKEKSGTLPLLADMKACDDGITEAALAFSAGADIMTVMGFVANQTIIDTLSVADKFGKSVMIDLLGIQSRERVEELRALGCNLFCIHIGKDMQKIGNLNFDNSLKLVEGIKNIQVAVAGGINVQLAAEMKNYPIDILIVGSYITLSENPKLMSKKIRDIIKT